MFSISLTGLKFTWRYKTYSEKYGEGERERWREKKKNREKKTDFTYALK